MEFEPLIKYLEPTCKDVFELTEQKLKGVNCYIASYSNYVVNGNIN